MLVMCVLFFFFFLTLSYSFSILLPNIPHVVFVSLSVDNLLTEALAYVILIWLSSHNLLSVYSFPNPSFYPAHPFSFFFFFFVNITFCRTCSRWWYQVPISTRLALYLGAMEEQQRALSPPVQSKVVLLHPLFPLLICDVFFRLCTVSDYPQDHAAINVLLPTDCALKGSACCYLLLSFCFVSPLFVPAKQRKIHYS